ncbi:unnamed protein product [Schistosoma turkestanicum]|nr:unnamed protein product [Schistosoma turkestanicum]
MSVDYSSEYDQLKCNSIASTDNCIKTNDRYSPNLTNSYEKMKHPGLTPSITAYRWITSQPTLPKSLFHKIEYETIAQWLSVSTTDDWLMHMPKCSVKVYDDNSLKNWKTNCQKQPHLSDEDRYATLYSISYEAKQLDQQTKSRPTSANRRNRPQPSRLFLNFRLHKLPKNQEKDT